MEKLSKARKRECG